MKWLKRLGVIFLLIFLSCSLGIWYAAKNFLNNAPENPGKEQIFDVAAGSAPAKIARDLYAKNLITDVNKFLWLIRLKDDSNKLQAGRFMLNTGWKPEKILDVLVNGKAILNRVTIPEGLTWWQTGKLLEAEGFVRFTDFKEIISDPDFLRHYGIPFANAEGFLMPDTYLMKKPDFEEASASEEERDKIWKTQARAVAGRLIDNFWRKAERLWPAYEDKKVEGTIYRPARQDLKEWVILASIVEKETRIDKERGKVAGVYANRLDKNMLLQADPTVIYGLGPDFKGTLNRAQLQDAKNLYNTYQNPGLPPGPISSFGSAALKAAINPDQHSYLYFVAISDGGEHKFSKTLEQHNRAVKEYRERKRKSP